MKIRPGWRKIEAGRYQNDELQLRVVRVREYWDLQWEVAEPDGRGGWALNGSFRMCFTMREAMEQAERFAQSNRVAS